MSHLDLLSVFSYSIDDTLKVLFYHVLAGLAIIAQLRCMLSDPGKFYFCIA